MSEAVNVTRRPDRFWWCAGTALVVCNVGLLALGPAFHYDSPLSERPILAATFLLLTASAIYFIAALRAHAAPPTLRVVIVFALLARAPLLLAPPIQEDDIHRYVWDGRVAACGLDPYAFSPAEILGYERGDGAFLPDDLETLTALAALKNSTPALTRIFGRINNPTFATIYPPLTQVVFSIHGRFVPSKLATRWQVVLMKALLAVFDLLILGGLIGLLALADKPLGLCVLYAWCPLVLKEFSNSGHMDAIPTAFVIFALCALCRRRALLFGVLLGMAVGAKIYALLLLPFGLRTLGGRRSWLALAAFAGVTVLPTLLFPRGDGRHDRTLISFALGWENHDAVFFWLCSLWSSVVGDEPVNITLRGATFAVGKGYLLTLITAGTMTLAIAACAAWRARQDLRAEVIPRVAFTILAAIFLLGPLGFPWYFTWCVPLLPFVRLRTWYLLPGLLMIYYLRFWYDYQYPDGYSGFSRGVDFFDRVVASVEFGVFYAILFAEAWLTRKKRSIL